MADITAAQAAFQTARDALNQAADDLVTAANDAATGNGAIQAAVEQAAQTLAPFVTPPTPA